MKFSYRVTFIAVSCLVLVFTLGSITGRWYWEREPASKSVLVKSKDWSRHVSKSNPTFTPAVRDTSSECVFSRQRKAKSDVYMADLLQMISDGEKAVGTGEEVPLGVREKKNSPLKIIVVPHSHNDPGWHKTVDVYFADQSKHTLNNMVEKLRKYPEMKFVWAETIFLDLWWRELDHSQRGKMALLLSYYRWHRHHTINPGWRYAQNAVSKLIAYINA